MYSFTCLIKSDRNAIQNCMPTPFDDDKFIEDVIDLLPDDDDSYDDFILTKEVPQPVGEVFIGLKDPTNVISFAVGMKSRMMQSALALASDALKHTDLTVANSLAQCFTTIPTDSTDSYMLRCAVEMLDNHPNSECCELYYNGSTWKCFPYQNDVDDVIAHPENYIVLPLMFADK